MWWDNDNPNPLFNESNTYVTGLGTTLSSHVKFTGQANIVPGWYAGYVLHLEVISGDSLTQNEALSRGPALYGIVQNPLFGPTFGPSVQALQSYWFIKSDHLGKLGVGLQSQASDNTAILVDGSGSLVPANWVAFDYRGFHLPSGQILGAAACGTMGGAVGDCNGLTQNVVRYDSPTFGGFSVSASWGEDDMWDVAARYAGEFNGFKIAAAAAYNEVSACNDYNGLCAPGLFRGGYNNLGPLDADYFQAGLYVEHVPTGIFGLVNYGKYDDNTAQNFGFVAAPEQDTWYFKAGLRERWHPLGHTVLYGEYETVDDAYGVQGGDFRLWGLGVVQEIDAAAMSVWVSYRNIEADDHDAAAQAAFGSSEAEFQYIKAGALINF
jgi:predicted porin